MGSYLVVDDTDGRVLAELASGQQVVRLLGRLARSAQGDPQVRVVRLDQQVGTLTAVASAVSMQPLAPLMERPAKRRRGGAEVRDGRGRRARGNPTAPGDPG